MQHWHVYTKWNERLFHEMYLAYMNGRAEKDPSIGWYKGELWFYDNYIIPLAKKLENCEYLQMPQTAQHVSLTIRVLESLHSEKKYCQFLVSLSGGVFGVSSDEFLSYAEMNRAEWEAKGEQIVEGMINKYSQGNPKAFEEGSPKELFQV